MRPLERLPTTCQDAYLLQHGQSRLGAREDELKSQFGRDSRLKQLQQLSTVDMMPTKQLRDFQNALFGLETCLSRTKQDLAVDPVCPHCAFRPVEEPFSGAKAGDRVTQLDTELESLLQGLTNTLLAKLQDPTVARNIDRPGTGKGRTALLAFLTSKCPPNPVNRAFVKALQEILSGLEKVVRSEAGLHSALADGGFPCSLGDLKERFDSFLAGLTKGKDEARVRIVVERG